MQTAATLAEEQMDLKATAHTPPISHVCKSVMQHMLAVSSPLFAPAEMSTTPSFFLFPEAGKNTEHELSSLISLLKPLQR